MAHVDLVIRGMHHRTGAEEHVSLEETVYQQQEDRVRIAGRPDARSQHHVADLGHR